MRRDGRGTFLQHHFDTRGLARVFESEDGNRIDGTFEIAHDHETWEKDFGGVYTRVG